MKKDDDLDLIPKYTFNGVPVYASDTVQKDEILFVNFNVDENHFFPYKKSAPVTSDPPPGPDEIYREDDGDGL